MKYIKDRPEKAAKDSDCYATVHRNLRRFRQTHQPSKQALLHRQMGSISKSQNAPREFERRKELAESYGQETLAELE